MKQPSTVLAVFQLERVSVCRFLRRPGSALLIEGLPSQRCAPAVMKEILQPTCACSRGIQHGKPIVSGQIHMQRHQMALSNRLSLCHKTKTMCIGIGRPKGFNKACLKADAMCSCFAGSEVRDSLQSLQPWVFLDKEQRRICNIGLHLDAR